MESGGGGGGQGGWTGGFFPSPCHVGIILKPTGIYLGSLFRDKPAVP